MLPEAARYKKEWQSAQQSRIDSGVDCAYLYVHIEADSGKIFYVGFGETVGRPWDKTCRSPNHRQRIKDHGFDVRVIISNINTETALFWEKIWISRLRAEGFDLENKASGGQRGWNHHDDSKNKISLNNSMKREECRVNQKIGVIAAWGSEERRENLSVNNPMKNPEIAKRNSELRRGGSLPQMRGSLHPRARIVVEISENKVFGSAIEASDYYNIPSGDILAVCSRRQKTAKGKVFAYANEKYCSEHELINIEAQRAAEQYNVDWKILLSAEEISARNAASWDKDRRKKAAGRRLRYAKSPEGIASREKQFGENGSNAKITEETAQMILDFVGTHAAAAREFNVSYDIAFSIRKRTSWKHLQPSEKE